MTLYRQQIIAELLPVKTEVFTVLATLPTASPLFQASWEHSTTCR